MPQPVQATARFAREHVFMPSNGITLHVVQAGPVEGPVALLLHGFPETWRAWSAQIDALADAGYRVWLPDQRGYGESERPSGVRSYHLDTLADDIRGLVAQSGQRKVALLGHDWGGGVAWWLAYRHPELIERLVVVNAPHVGLMARQMTRSLRQLRRSLYMFLFQLPRLPEFILLRDGQRALLDMFARTSRPGTFDAADLAAYRVAWTRPGAMTAMLDWYRAGVPARPAMRRMTRVAVPVLLIWGEQDAFLERELAGASIELCDRGRLATIEEAGHWVLREASTQVNRLVVEFLSTCR